MSNTMPSYSIYTVVTVLQSIFGNFSSNMWHTNQYLVSKFLEVIQWLTIITIISETVQDRR